MKSSSILAGLVAAFASVVAAVREPVGEPTGNAIVAPGLNQIVDAGKPFTITWTPTTTGPLSIVLLRGPGENIVRHSVIVESIENTGTYVWTPSTTLEDDVTHYGIQIIDDATGQNQYSTQFGISNPEPLNPVSSSSVVEPTHTPTPTPSSPLPPIKTPIVTYETTYETVTECDCTKTPVAPSSTGIPPKNSGNSTAPSSSSTYVVPSATPSPTDDLFTGAASQMKAGGAMVAVVAVIVAALF